MEGRQRDRETRDGRREGEGGTGRGTGRGRESERASEREREGQGERMKRQWRKEGGRGRAVGAGIRRLEVCSWSRAASKQSRTRRRAFGASARPGAGPVRGPPLAGSPPVCPGARMKGGRREARPRPACRSARMKGGGRPLSQRRCRCLRLPLARSHECLMQLSLSLSLSLSLLLSLTLSLSLSDARMSAICVPPAPRRPSARL